MRLRRFPIPFSAKLLLPTVVLLIALIAGAWLILAIHGQRAAELASRTQVQSAEQALRLFFSAQSQRLSALATPTTPSVQEPGVWRGRLATDLTPLSDVPEDVQEVLAVFRRIAPHLTMTQGIAFPMVANGKLYAVWARQDATGESGQAVIRVAMTSIQPAFDNLLLHWPSIQASLLGLHPLSKEWELWVAPPHPRAHWQICPTLCGTGWPHPRHRSLGRGWERMAQRVICASMLACPPVLDASLSGFAQQAVRLRWLGAMPTIWS